MSRQRWHVDAVFIPWPSMWSIGWDFSRPWTKHLWIGPFFFDIWTGGHP